MARRLSTFLMFQGGDAEAAMRWYVSLFDGASIDALERWGEAGPGRAGTVKLARFTVAGHRLMCSDSPPVHAFGFTPSLSLFVDCGDDDEFERLFAALSEDGGVLMPPGDYGFSRRFGWCNDRHGVSWQLNLA